MSLEQGIRSANPVPGRLGFWRKSKPAERIGVEASSNVGGVAVGLPVDGRDFEKTMLGPVGKQAEDVSEVGLGLDVAEPRAREQ
jgi:hypothetical protein